MILLPHVAASGYFRLVVSALRGWALGLGLLAALCAGESVPLQKPDPFVDSGRDSGSAGFNDVSSKTAEASRIPVRVTRSPLCAGQISPLQYGQFVEYLCNLVPAMWAEKLYDGSFEGLSPYKFVFIKETDFKERPWHPSGAVNRAEYELDRSTRVSGEVSQRIRVAGGAPCTVGVSQDGIAVERGEACEFKVWLRSSDLSGPVQVRLHEEAKILAGGWIQPGADWKPFSLRLRPLAGSVNATMTIEFRGPGTLWLDNASLMSLATAGGWRPDVVAAVRALKPGIIRFGGSTLDDPNLGEFEWKDTVGDPDHRRPFHAWGGLQPTGPGLGEFVDFCRRVGAEPLICVRFSRRQPKDAAEEVEYFNGSVATPMGAWRARNGRPEPYRIKYWQVGNERGGEDYEERLAAFCEAMRRADPTIHLLSSFPTPGVLQRAGRFLDFVCPHQYSHDLAAMDAELRSVDEMIHRWAPDRGIKIGVTEWNTTAGDAGPRRAMLWTLANALACSRYHNLLHRHADSVAIANRSNLMNSFCSGIIQTDRYRLYRTPTYYAQQLYATLAGQVPLRLESDLPANVGVDLSATLALQSRSAEPAASGLTPTELASGSGEVVLFGVNDGLSDIVRPLDFSAFGRRGQKLAVWTLTDRRHAGEPDVTNDFGEPDRVLPVRSEFRAANPRFDYRFPALTLTVLKWRIE